MFSDLFANNDMIVVHGYCSPGFLNMSYGEQFGERFVKCSLTMFAEEANKVTWRIVRPIVREMFMNSGRQSGQKRVLANNSANCSRTIHEQCSP